MKPLTEKQILSRLSPSYHPTFKRLQREYIQAGELIYAVGDCTKTEEKYVEPGPLRSQLTSSIPGFVIVTSYRWFRCGMDWRGGAGDNVVYRKIGSHFGSLFGGDVSIWEWVPPPKRLPTESKIGRQGFSKRVGEFIREVPLVDLPSVRSKFKHTILYDGQTIDLVEFYLEDGSWITFHVLDGDLVYSALQAAAHGKGKIIADEKSDDNPPVSANQEGAVQKLKQIKSMLDADLISQAEYDAKKAEILSRM